MEPAIVAGHQPGPQLTEVGGRVGPGHQFDDGVEQCAVEPRVGICPGHRGIPDVHVEPGVTGSDSRRDGLLGKHVQRMTWHP